MKLGYQPVEQDKIDLLHLSFCMEETLYLIHRGFRPMSSYRNIKGDICVGFRKTSHLINTINTYREFKFLRNNLNCISELIKDEPKKKA